tara:strand:- start:395 stop:598 length:204 start_codon:yes stop_codon:yes gene_type:complete
LVEPELFILPEETLAEVEDLMPDLPLLDITVIYLVVLVRVAAEEEEVAAEVVYLAEEDLGTLIEVAI